MLGFLRRWILRRRLRRIIAGAEHRESPSAKGPSQRKNNTDKESIA